MKTLVRSLVFLMLSGVIPAQADVVATGADDPPDVLPLVREAARPAARESSAARRRREVRRRDLDRDDERTEASPVLPMMMAMMSIISGMNNQQVQQPIPMYLGMNQGMNQWGMNQWQSSPYMNQGFWFNNANTGIYNFNRSYSAPSVAPLVQTSYASQVVPSVLPLK